MGVHIIEELHGRVAMYRKTHHALVDGVSAMRLLASVLSTDPDEADMPAMWARQPKRSDHRGTWTVERRSRPCRSGARSALGITAEAAGMPAALVKTLSKGLRNETSSLSLYAPRTILNQNITGSRRIAIGTGRSTDCARSARRRAPRSTTSCSRCAAERCGPTCSSSARCPTRRS